MDQHTARLHAGCREGGVYLRRRGGLKLDHSSAGVRSGIGTGRKYYNKSAHTHTAVRILIFVMFKHT